MKLFGTDGIRGKAGAYPLDSATIHLIGSAAARVLRKEGLRPLMLIGRDTRESGSDISEALKDSLATGGIEVWDVGILPTPAVSYLARQNPVLAGIVITASHNPYQDNGIKFFGHNGTKLADTVEELIEDDIARQSALPKEINESLVIGELQSCTALAGAYVAFLKSTFPSSEDLRGMRIVVDCANGSCSSVIGEVFGGLGAEVFAINNTPDGRNINQHCGALYPDVVARETVRKRAHCGLAFDGDGDRVIFSDENGEVRDGDFLLSIVADHLTKKKQLTGNTMVTTVMANLGLFHAMRERGVNVITTDVGDRYVYEAMLRCGATLGGEQSGHIIFMDHLPTGDGIISALQILGIMKETAKPLSELSGIMKKYPQVLHNTKVGRKIPIEGLPLTRKIIMDTETKLKADGDGRVLVRYSGTENLLRVMIEGLDRRQITEMADEISDTAVEEIENYK